MCLDQKIKNIKIPIDCQPKGLSSQVLFLHCVRPMSIEEEQGNVIIFPHSWCFAMWASVANSSTNLLNPF